MNCLEEMKICASGVEDHINHRAEEQEAADSPFCANDSLNELHRRISSLERFLATMVKDFRKYETNSPCHTPCLDSLKSISTKNSPPTIDTDLKFTAIECGKTPSSHAECQSKVLDTNLLISSFKGHVTDFFGGIFNSFSDVSRRIDSFSFTLKHLLHLLDKFKLNLESYISKAHAIKRDLGKISKETSKEILDTLCFMALLNKMPFPKNYKNSTILTEVSNSINFPNRFFFNVNSNPDVNLSRTVNDKIDLTEFPNSKIKYLLLQKWQTIFNKTCFGNSSCPSELHNNQTKEIATSYKRRRREMSESGGGGYSQLVHLVQSIDNCYHELDHVKRELVHDQCIDILFNK